MAEDAAKLLAMQGGEAAKIAELRAAADGLRGLLGTALPGVEAAGEAAAATEVREEEKP